MKRLGRIEQHLLAALYDACAPCTARQLAQREPSLHHFAAERGLERLVDRRLADRSEWSYGSGPRSYTLTAAGVAAHARLSEQRGMVTA